MVLHKYNSYGIQFCRYLICRYSIRFRRYLISQAFNSAGFSMLQVFKAAGIWVWRPYFWRFSILQVFDFEGFHVCRCSILQVFNSAGIRFRRFSILQVFKSAGFQFCRYSILQVFAPEGINFAGIVSKGLMSAGVLSVSLKNHTRKSVIVSFEKLDFAAFNHMKFDSLLFFLIHFLFRFWSFHLSISISKTDTACNLSICCKRIMTFSGWKSDIMFWPQTM